MSKESIPPNLRCRFCGKNAPLVDYKDTNTLQKFVSSQGKIYDRKKMGTCAKHQRRLAREIKRARFLSLMKFTG